MQNYYLISVYENAELVFGTAVCILTHCRKTKICE